MPSPPPPPPLCDLPLSHTEYGWVILPVPDDCGVLQAEASGFLCDISHWLRRMSVPVSHLLHQRPETWATLCDKRLTGGFTAGKLVSTVLPSQFLEQRQGCCVAPCLEESASN